MPRNGRHDRSELLFPYGPGGIGDLLVRLTTDRLTKYLANLSSLRTGRRAAGSSAWKRGAAAQGRLHADEAGGSQFSVVPLMHKLNYDPLKELTPIGIIAVNGMALAVNNDLPIRSVKEFIDYAKANPGKLNYATGGVGTSSHLVPAAFAARTGIDLVAMPYQSTPQSIVGILRIVPSLLRKCTRYRETARCGRIRLLALSNATRIAQFPDVPTIAETVPGFVMTGWNGYFAPTGTPIDIINDCPRRSRKSCTARRLSPRSTSSVSNRSATHRRKSQKPSARSCRSTPRRPRRPA